MNVIVQVVVVVIGLPVVLTALFFGFCFMGVIIMEKIHPTKSTPKQVIYFDDYIDDWPIPYDGDGLGGWSS